MTPWTKKGITYRVVYPGIRFVRIQDNHGNNFLLTYDELRDLYM